MPTLAAEPLRELAAALLAAADARPDHARTVGDSLVDANLAGHDSHGVQLLPHYVRSAQDGTVDPAADPVVSNRDRGTATVDGAFGWGQVATNLAVATVIECARDHGIGAVVVHRCRHIGRVAPYVEAIAAAGMIGLAVASTPPSVAPFGGRQRVFGTNPIAWALPRGDGQPPICLDVATSTVAYGKVEVARARGVPVPPGVLLDRDGEPTTDPAALRDGGVLTAFGAHKGSGFAAFAQFIGMALAGFDTTAMDKIANGNGTLLLALDVAPFLDPLAFFDAVDRQAAVITDSTPLPGVERVLLPGDLGFATRSHRSSTGIPMPDTTWTALSDTATSLGVPMPDLDLIPGISGADVAPAIGGRPVAVGTA